ncbi:MAG: type I methionyl aminopeptidase [Candidatus Omnitrophota bacterium]
MPSKIPIKAPDDLKIMREGAGILSRVVKRVAALVRPDQTTAAIDLLTEQLIEEQHCRPAFKGYRGFPAAACVSLNHEVVHGIPGETRLKTGDIVSIDVGLIHKGFYADMAVTVAVGEITDDRRRLMDVTRTALYEGIAQARPGQHVSDISHAVQQYAEANGMSVVRDFVGHGIGRMLHEEPEIPNYGPRGQGAVLQEGMVFCIEPMVNLGTDRTEILSDGWTVETADKKPSAHFEHMVAVTENGPDILTE